MTKKYGHSWRPRSGRAGQPFTYEGVTYPTQAAAAKALGVSPKTICTWAAFGVPEQPGFSPRNAKETTFDGLSFSTLKAAHVHYLEKAKRKCHYTFFTRIVKKMGFTNAVQFEEFHTLYCKRIVMVRLYDTVHAPDPSLLLRERMGESERQVDKHIQRIRNFVQSLDDAGIHEHKIMKAYLQIRLENTKTVYFKNKAYSTEM
jgi:hypothetical protein